MRMACIHPPGTLVVAVTLLLANNVSSFCTKGVAVKSLWKSGRIYACWRGMKIRCSPQCSEHNIKYYYSKGIRVCPEWESYPVFKKWAIENGYTDQLTIDRVDATKGYAPENCRWATRSEQMLNRWHPGYVLGTREKELAEKNERERSAQLRKEGKNKDGKTWEMLWLEHISERNLTPVKCSNKRASWLDKCILEGRVT